MGQIAEEIERQGRARRNAPRVYGGMIPGRDQHEGRREEKRARDPRRGLHRLFEGKVNAALFKKVQCVAPRAIEKAQSDARRFQG